MNAYSSIFACIHVEAKRMFLGKGKMQDQQSRLVGIENQEFCFGSSSSGGSQARR